jgi:hypothetical protein
LAVEGFETLDRALLPPTALVDWPTVALDADQARRLSHGQRVPAEAAWLAAAVRLYGPGGISSVSAMLAAASSRRNDFSSVTLGADSL